MTLVHESMAILTLEQVFFKHEITDQSTLGNMNYNGISKKFKKSLKLCGIMGDLAQLGSKFEILNLHDENVVRKITITDTINIDPCDNSGIIAFDKNTPIFYEEWFMDRGSYMFYMGDRLCKLATEYDIVQIIEK